MKIVTSIAIACSFLLIDFSLLYAQADTVDQYWKSDILNFEFKSAYKNIDANGDIDNHLKGAVLYVIYSFLGHEGKAEQYQEFFLDNYKDHSELSFYHYYFKYRDKAINEEEFVEVSSNLKFEKQSEFLILHTNLIRTSSQDRETRFNLASHIHDMAEEYSWQKNYFHIQALGHYARMSKNSGITEETFNIAYDLSVATALDHNSNTHHAHLLRHIASHYRRQSKQELCINYFDKYFQVSRNYCVFNGTKFLDDDHLVYFVIGQTYNDIDDLKNARVLFNKSIQVLEAHNDKDSKTYIQRMAFYRNGLAILDKKEGHVQKAYEELIKSYETLMNSQYSNFIWLPEIQHNLATILVDLGREDEAEQLLVDVLTNLNAKYLFDFEHADDYSQVFSALRRMSKLLAPKWEAAKRIVHNRYMLKLAHHLCFIYRDFSLQERILKKYKKWFTREIEYFVSQFESNSSEFVIHLAELIEAQKNIAFMSSYALDYSNEISSLIKEQKLLEAKIENDEVHEYKHKLIKDSIKLVTQRLNFLREPKKSKVKMNFLRPNFKMLNLDEMYINFFIHNSNFYKLEISFEGASVNELANIEVVDSLINDFRHHIYSGFLDCGDDPLVEIRTIKNKGRVLYNTLFNNTNIKKTPKLYISPDSKIALLPFDALVSSEGDDYFVESYNWSFQNGFDFMTSRNRIIDIDIVDLFAPIFEQQEEVYCDVDQYRLEYMGPLIFNSEEVESIAKIFPRSRSNTSRDQFIDKVENSKFLHLATHSKVDFVDNENSFIAFTDNKHQIEKLSIRELQFIKSNAESVVLSSCESGVGLYEYGKGLTSLSKTFLSMGVQSVVSSLWSVNDRSNAMIMANYYQNLKEGVAKHEALGKAKSSFLKSVDAEYQHPFYWAGLMIEGDIAAVNIKEDFWFIGSSWLFMMITLILLISFLVYYLVHH